MEARDDGLSNLTRYRKVGCVSVRQEAPTEYALGGMYV